MDALKEVKSILVLGATSETGSQVVRHALAKGLCVTVMIPDPMAFNTINDHPNLEILKGDVLNYPDVYNAVQGNDAIISVLGIDNRETESLTRGTSNILRAFHQSSIQKFICLSSMGAGSTKKLTGWRLKWVLRLTGQESSYEAKAEQELMLYHSTIDFTLVMAGGIVDQMEPSETYALSLQQAPCYVGNPPKVSRTFVANFMVSQLNSDKWKRRTVCLVNAD